jgi:hypothetical protein
VIIRRRSSREKEERARLTAVIFSVPERRLSAMVVAAGPCVPLPERKTSVASVHAQVGYETPAITSTLFRVLTGRDDTELLTLIAREGEGRLYCFSDRFVAAMAEASRHLIELSHESPSPPHGEEDGTPFGLQLTRWDEAWMREADWPLEMASTRNRVHRIGQARVAQEKGLPLYVWYGPRVPEYVVASGTGPYPGKG